MKKLTILLLSTMAIGLTFISCGEKKDSNFLLEGKWVYFQKGIESKNDAVLYTYDENCDLEVDSGTWFKKNDKITIVFPKAGTETAEIITLDETTLKVKAKINNEIIIYVFKKV